MFKAVTMKTNQMLVILGLVLVSILSVGLFFRNWIWAKYYLNRFENIEDNTDKCRIIKKLLRVSRVSHSDHFIRYSFSEESYSLQTGGYLPNSYAVGEILDDQNSLVYFGTVTDPITIFSTSVGIAAWLTNARRYRFRVSLGKEELPATIAKGRLTDEGIMLVPPA